MSTPSDAMREAMADSGIITDEPIVADGILHRIRVVGDRRGTRNGWYVLHADGRPAGAAGHWRTGATCRWTADGPRPMQIERCALAKRIARAQADAEAQRNAEYATRAIEARQVWASASLADPSHPYLVAKRVLPHGLRQCGRVLQVPLVDADGTLSNVQRIWTNGRKRYMRGRMRGLMSRLGDPKGAKCVFVCEGWATAATLYESYGYPVLAAMSAGNLLIAASSVRAKWPSPSLVIAADTDRHTPGNPGLTYATDAARATGARLMVPPFADGEEGSDWNDYAALRRGETGHD